MGFTQENIDETMMRRALVLAARGEGYTAPNPMVGCVIAKGDTIVGEGWHRGRHWHSVDGLPHAEAMALNGAGHAARDATAYVTLEPCNHHGKTPPCADALIDSGVKRVVYAIGDPNPTASGGAHKLRSAGVAVSAGLLKEEAIAQNRAWIWRMKTGLPFVTLKFAASLDGKIATQSGDSKWITGTKARNRAHDLRQAADAIIVGANTVITDNPSLTVRNNNTPSHPLRIILDRTARTNPLAKIYSRETPGNSLLVTTNKASSETLEKFRQLSIETLTLNANNADTPALLELLKELAARGLNHVMVEGGAAVLGSFIDANLAQEVWAFIAPVMIGGTGKNAIGGVGANTMADALRLQKMHTEQIGSDLLIRGFLPGVLNTLETEVPCLQAS